MLVIVIPYFFRETNLLDIDLLTQNLTAAHSLSQFLVAVAEECPEKFLPLVSLVVQFLEWEVNRNSYLIYIPAHCYKIVTIIAL